MDRRLFKNIFGSWLGLGATVIVGFFLTPFVLHYLGDVGFGLWILTTTVTGYYGLMDLGLRSAIVRYVSKDVASGDWEGVSRTASTTFFSYSIIGLLIALITLLVVWKFDILFHVAPQWSRSGKLLLLVMGIGSAVTVPVALFGGILEGIQKFYFVVKLLQQSPVLAGTPQVLSFSAFKSIERPKINFSHVIFLWHHHVWNQHGSAAALSNRFDRHR